MKMTSIKKEISPIKAYVLIILVLTVLTGIYFYLHTTTVTTPQSSIIQTKQKLSPTVSNSFSKLAQPGEHCGGFIRNAKKCVSGYHCQLNHIPDTGGICVAN